MMIASSPFAPSPAAGAVVPAAGAGDAAATAFTLTLQSIAAGPDSGLTAPLLAGAPAAPGQPLLASPEGAVALPGQPLALPGGVAAPLTLARLDGAIVAAPAAADAAPTLPATTPATTPAAPSLPETVAARPQGGDAALPAPVAGQPLAPVDDAARPIAVPVAPAATTAAPAPVPAIQAAPKADPTAEAGAKKAPRMASHDQPARTGVAKAAGETGSDARFAEPVLAELIALPAGEAPLPGEAAADPLAETETLLAGTGAEALPAPLPVQVPEPVARAPRGQVAAADAGDPPLAGAERTSLAAVKAAGAAEALAATPASAPSPAPADGAAFALRPEMIAPDGAATEGAALPSPLVGQTITATAIRPVNVHQLYPTQSAPPAGTVTAQPGRLGREMGVEIARRVSAGQDEMLIRLNPQEMGRIEVRLSFDEAGAVRAVLASESPAALEMLRRETGDLARSLADAGVRSDAQSFRFDRGTGDGFGQRGQGGSDGQQGRPGSGLAFQGGADEEQDASTYRQLRSSGQVNLIA